MKYNWLLIILLVVSICVILWMIVSSFVSYAPMSATQMQNLYIDDIVKYGGVSLALQSIVVVLLGIGIFRHNRKQQK